MLVDGEGMGLDGEFFYLLYYPKVRNV